MSLLLPIRVPAHIRAVVLLLLLSNSSRTRYTQVILYWTHPLPPTSFLMFVFPIRETPDSLDMQMSSEYHYLRVLVISALSTLGIPEDSFISAFSTLRTREDCVKSAFRTLRTHEVSVISAFSTLGTRKDVVISASGTLVTRKD